jgi:hypothetical protein
MAATADHYMPNPGGFSSDSAVHTKRLEPHFTVIFDRREAVMRDFAIHLTHKPGELARIANALSRAGINLKSVSGTVIGNQGLLRIIADDVDAARRALQESRIPFDENEVVTVLLENQAGELENVAAKLANANVNLHAVYVVGLDGDLVELAIVADDPKKAKKALE